MASKAGHERAALPVPPYTIRSSGRSATSDSAPPLAIYAISVDTPGSYRVVHTAPIVRAPASTTYTMLAVEPGTYVVVASAVDASGRPTGTSLSGAYTPAVACGLTAS